MTEVQLPDIGDFHDVEVIEVLVSPGDVVEPEASLITLESDKATMEIPSPVAGVVREVKVDMGDKINQGDVIVVIETSDAVATEGTPEEASVEETPPPSPRKEVIVEDAVETAGEVGELIVELPDIGDFTDVEVIEVLVAAGDVVEKESSLITLESDKATMEIPSPHAGIVREVVVSVGDRINQGDRLAVLEGSTGRSVEAAETAEPLQSPPAAAASAPETPRNRRIGDKEVRRPPVAGRASDAEGRTAHASPAVRRFARELGVDLFNVTGTAAKGRITKDDVQEYVKRSLASGGGRPSGGAGAFELPKAPVVDFSKFGEIEEKPLGRIKKISGAHLHRSWLGIPHVTQFDEADITELEAFRKAQKDVAAKQDVKLTFMPFLMKALAAAMSEYPQFNSSLSEDGENLIQKKYLHIGVAVDTPNGLMVPVVRDVDQKGVFDIARDLMDLSGKARDGKLAPGDMQGGCISISSLGGIGGTQFTPIVNAPEVAILGVSRAAMKPVWNGAEFEPRLIMPFSLSYDHRVIDGAEGVRFTSYLSSLLADIRRLLL